MLCTVWGKCVVYCMGEVCCVLYGGSVLCTEWGSVLCTMWWKCVMNCGGKCVVYCEGSVLYTAAWVKCLMYCDVGEVCCVVCGERSCVLRGVKCVVYCVG